MTFEMQREAREMGFTGETFAYLADLKANNEKAWFDANRERYEEVWKSAGLSFIAGISERMAALEPPLRAVPKLNGSLRRINRDVRFSKDKSPYNASLHMIFSAGDHPNRSPGVHIVLHPRGVGYGAGHYGIAPDRLAEIRDRIIDKADGDALIAALERAGEVGCRMGEPDLARLPKGYEAEGRRCELLRYKSVVVRTFEGDAPPGVVIGDGAEDWVMETTGTLMPLIRWLAKK